MNILSFPKNENYCKNVEIITVSKVITNGFLCTERRYEPVNLTNLDR